MASPMVDDDNPVNSGVSMTGKPENSGDQNEMGGGAVRESEGDNSRSVHYDIPTGAR